MSDVAELKQVIIQQHLAIGRAGKFLGDLGANGKGQIAEEAWSIFSELMAVAGRVKGIVDRELGPSPTQTNKEK